MVTVVLVIVVVVIVGMTAGIVLFNRFRRRDRLVVRLCHLFELEPVETHQETVDANVRRALVEALKAKQTDFDFDQFKQELGVDADVARQVAEEVYRRYCTLSLIDGNISQREAKTLNALADLLHLRSERAGESPSLSGSAELEDR